MSFLRRLFTPPTPEEKYARLRMALKDLAGAQSISALMIKGDKVSQLLKEPDAMEMLLRAIQDEDRDVRASSISALSTRPDPRAVPLLQQALNDPEDNVRLRAADACKSLGIVTA